VSESNEIPNPFQTCYWQQNM